MADKQRFYAFQLAQQAPITGRKIGVPPLENHQIRLPCQNLLGAFAPVKWIRRMQNISGALHFKGVVLKILLLFAEENFGILHLKRDHLRFELLSQIFA